MKTRIEGYYRDQRDECIDLLLRMDVLPALALAGRAVQHAAGQIWMIQDPQKLLQVITAIDELIGKLEEMKKQIKRRLRLVHRVKISYDEDILYYTNYGAR